MPNNLLVPTIKQKVRNGLPTTTSELDCLLSMLKNGVLPTASIPFINAGNYGVDPANGTTGDTTDTGLTGYFTAGNLRYLFGWNSATNAFDLPNRGVITSDMIDSNFTSNLATQAQLDAKGVITDHRVQLARIYHSKNTTFLPPQNNNFATGGGTSRSFSWGEFLIPVFGAPVNIYVKTQFSIICRFSSANPSISAKTNYISLRPYYRQSLAGAKIYLTQIDLPWFVAGRQCIAFLSSTNELQLAIDCIIDHEINQTTINPIYFGVQIDNPAQNGSIEILQIETRDINIGNPNIHGYSDTYKRLV